MAGGVAGVYVRAFFEIAGFEECSRTWQDLLELEALMRFEGELSGFFAHPKTTQPAKQQALEMICDGLAFSKLSRNFVLFLQSEGRWGCLALLCKTMGALLEQARQDKHVVVVSSVRLGEQSLLQCAELAKVVFGVSQVQVEHAVQPAVLGGVLLSSGAHRLDLTISGSFKQLQRAVLESI